MIAVDTSRAMLDFAAQKAEAAVHFREEYSTFDWILEGMLERVGFDITDKKTHSPTRIEYLCRA